MKCLLYYQKTRYAIYIEWDPYTTVEQEDDF